MKITVFGATGGTGRHVVTDALAAGHAVTAVTRPHTQLPAAARGPGGAEGPGGAGRAEIVPADVMNPLAIEAAVAGADVVISALGIRPGAKEPVCAPGTESIIKAMRATGGRRLVVVTAAGHVTDPHDGLLTAKVVKPILGVFLRRSFAAREAV